MLRETVKQRAIEALQTLPDAATLDDPIDPDGFTTAAKGCSTNGASER